MSLASCSAFDCSYTTSSTIEIMSSSQKLLQELQGSDDFAIDSVKCAFRCPAYLVQGVLAH